MKLAVLMTCHNRKDKTINCLGHLLEANKNNDFLMEIFLVDDASTDGTKETVEALYPFVHVIRGDGNLFWNRGMCLAWSSALKFDNFDAFLWLNDDTMLHPDALSFLNKMSSDNQDAIIVGTISDTKNTNVITYGGYRNGKIVSPSSDNLNCDRFNGNCVYIPFSVTQNIGYLDPYYRHSWGDFDYSLRAFKANISIIITPVIGNCDRNPPEPIWNKGSLINRFKKLYSPLGNNPFETFHFYNKTSFFKAFLMFVYIHLRVLFTFIKQKKTF